MLKHVTRKKWLLLAANLLLVLSLYATAVGQALARPSDIPDWEICPASDASLDDNIATGAAASRTSAVSVGFYQPSSGEPYRPYILHKVDGADVCFALVPVGGPIPTTSHAYFNGVSAVRLGLSSSEPDKYYAVGGRGADDLAQAETGEWQPTNNSQTFIEMSLDGGATWQLMPSPALNIGTANNVLTGVSALSTNDVWVVGYYQDIGQAERPLVGHWNGIEWLVSPVSGLLGARNFLTSVYAIANKDVWAVGYVLYGPGEYDYLVYRWDGTSWASNRVEPSPAINFLMGVTCPASDDCWAVGVQDTLPTLNNKQVLIMRWFNGVWRVVESPNIPGVASVLWGVAHLEADNVWAVGSSGDSLSRRTLALNWDGLSWQIVLTPNAGLYGNELRAVGVAPKLPSCTGRTVWSPGYYEVGFPTIARTLTLKLQYPDSCGGGG